MIPDLSGLTFTEKAALYTRYAGTVRIPVDMEKFLLHIDEYWPPHHQKASWSRCCHADTLIPTSQGILRIEDICTRFHNGEDFHALSDEGQRKVTDAINSGEMAGIQYFASNGSRGTVGLDHKFKCINSRGFLHWKPAHTLHPGDKVVAVNQVHPSPPPVKRWSLETVDPLLDDLPSKKEMPREVMLGDVNLKRCFVRRAFDLFEIARGPGMSITFDDSGAAWEFFMIIVSIGVRPHINDRTVVVLNVDVDTIMKGCSHGQNFPHGPSHLNEFLRSCNGDLVSITFVSETRSQMYDISIEGSPTYFIGGLATHNTTL